MQYVTGLDYITQEDKVLEYLSKGKSITLEKAVKKYKIYDVSAVVYRLRKRGYDIKTTKVDGVIEYNLPNPRHNKWLEKAVNMNY